MPERSTDLPIATDRVLLATLFALIAFGLVMVASASVAVGERLQGDGQHFAMRQLFYVGLGIALMLMMRSLPTRLFERLSPLILLLGIGLLVVVLIPGIGTTVNGSTRWLSLVVFQLQVSEFVKLAVVLYMAGYLVRRGEQVRARIMGFIKPMLLIGVVALLLLLEPDMGAATVILLTALVMMFVAGVRLWQFSVLMLVSAGALGALALAEPYRVRRITGFLDPWADPFDSGFQLTQALIAIGRGEWFGVGLGESIQKLHYLPEAHTDFIFAVIAEEFGLLGGLLLLGAFSIVVVRMFRVARRAERLNLGFSAYTAIGIGTWMAIQVVTNLAVNMGLMPTKGLTLPLISYGGSSMLITCVSVGLVLAIDRECAALEQREAHRELPSGDRATWLKRAGKRKSSSAKSKPPVGDAEVAHA